MTPAAIVPPTDLIQISINNLTGECQLTMSRPLPFPVVATALGMIIGQLGVQAAAGPGVRAAAAPVSAPNGAGGR